MASEMFKELWEDRRRLSGDETQAMKTQLLVLDERTEKLLNRLIETDNRTAIQKYENEVTRLEEEKLLIRERIQKCGRPLEPFEDCFRTAMTFLANPCHYWSSDRLEDKRMVLRLVFAKRLAYHRKEGFRTAKNEELSLPFRYLKNFETCKYEMVRKKGLFFDGSSIAGWKDINESDMIILPDIQQGLHGPVRRAKNDQDVLRYYRPAHQQTLQRATRAPSPRQRRELSKKPQAGRHRLFRPRSRILHFR
jgi:hypothetical protein